MKIGGEDEQNLCFVVCTIIGYVINSSGLPPIFKVHSF